MMGTPRVPNPGAASRSPRAPIEEGTFTAQVAASVTANPCSTDAILEAYLNTAAVQTALHVKAKRFVVCGGVQYSKTMEDERTLIYPTVSMLGRPPSRGRERESTERGSLSLDAACRGASAPLPGPAARLPSACH